jgi:hypothetical protein
LQAVPSQLTVPLAGVWQAVHALGPHELLLLFEAHRPLQLCVPPAQMMLHSVLSSMHVPEHSFWPGGHRPPQVVPSHVASPPVGATHGVHDVPHVVGNLSSAQTLPQRWKPALQVKPQVAPSQVALAALAGMGQGAQLVPQLAGSTSSAQWSMHRCAPAPHATSTLASWVPTSCVPPSLAPRTRRGSVEHPASSWPPVVPVNV